MTTSCIRVIAVISLFAPAVPAQTPVPDLRQLVAKPGSELDDVARRYDADRGSVSRTYFVPNSPPRFARLKRFYESWNVAIQALDATKLSEEGRADHKRLTDGVKKELDTLEQQARLQRDIAPLVPFAPAVYELEERRRQMEPVDSSGAAGKLNAMRKQIERLRTAVESALKDDPMGAGPTVTKAFALAAAETIASARTSLKTWFNFYNLYDPVFSWWMVEPYKDADAALQDYAAFLKDKAAPKATAEKREKAESKSSAIPSDAVGPLNDAPDLKLLIAAPRSEMRLVLQKYFGDRGGRMAQLPGGANTPRTPVRSERTKKLSLDWLEALKNIEFDKLSRDGQVDYLLLRNQLEREVRRFDTQAIVRDEALKLVPFETGITALEAGVAKKEKTESTKAIELMKSLAEQVEKARTSLGGLKPKADAAASAARTIPAMKASLIEWYDFSAKVDDQWSAAVKEPYRTLRDAIDKYATLLSERAAAAAPKRDPSGIEGRPIGRAALLAELANELIPYTPEELIAIAEREYAWCEAQIKKASRDLGFGDDWRKAIEKVKNLHVEPGKQPELIRDLAREAVDYLRRHNLVTVPPLADETWRADMMSPQRQLISPFFTGGEVITIAFPTSTMAHEAKLQSLRGNNVHFSRATVHHELIPGHHLQGFSTARHKTYRQPFATSFWTEGGALYWEFVLYDMGFPRTPEDKVGFLFWRMHRCARVVFSLGFHLGTMTPTQCVDYLVAKVAHERDNATAEVRRSFSGGYGPLYQLAYMMGGLQIRALRRELVDGRKMPERDFHDAMLQQGRLPIAMMRLALSDVPLQRDMKFDWKFYGPDPIKNPPRSETP